MSSRHGRRARPPTCRADVLIVSASMGAGHDGAARGLALQLRAAGQRVEIRDFLDSAPLRIGAGLRRAYELELKHLPSAYDATYRLWYRVPWLCPVVAWLVTSLTRRRVLRWVAETEATVVVSTYPLATLCLGRLRVRGRLRVPAVNFITDFGVHPLWVHDGMDLNLAIDEGPAATARARTRRRTVACGPVVSPAFGPDRLPERAAARRALGLLPDERAVLVVAGSWGVGDVRATWRAITRSGRFTPVVVCGRDRRLQSRVGELARGYAGGARVIGWTDDMPGLMAACDALVENAGGLTSLEAMRAGLPVVSFHPIAGHGKENTWGMAAAGVSSYAGDDSELTDALLALTSPSTERARQLRRAAAVFRADAAPLVMAEARLGATEATVPARVPAARVVARSAAALFALVALGWAGLTSGVALATEAGAGVAHPMRDSGNVAYVGVRLDAAELADPGVTAVLAAMHVTAVVDATTALTNVGALVQLTRRGINVENGGLGDPRRARGPDPDSLPWDRARGDAMAGRSLGLLIGRPVTVAVPGRRVNAWDLIECRRAHVSLVVPNHVLNPARPGRVALIHLTPRHIYLVNGLEATPDQLLAYLLQLNQSLRAEHLIATPLAKLV